MSGWPSGLRRQTQGSALSLDKGFSGDFWSSDEGVGSNPTSDNNSFETCDTEYRNICKSKYFNKFTDKISGSNPTKEKCLSNPSDFKARNATNSSPTTFVQSNYIFLNSGALLSPGCRGEICWRTYLSCLRSAVGSASVS